MNNKLLIIFAAIVATYSTLIATLPAVAKSTNLMFTTPYKTGNQSRY